MSWITFIWSMTAGICLTLGAVHFVVWTRRRNEWANLVFSITAAAAAGYAVLDMVALHVQTPAEYGELWRWALSLGMVESVAIVWFIRLHLRAGRLWLLWLICGLRALTLALNFAPGTNFYFREITGLQQMPLLGELISRPQGVLHPWVILMPLSFLVIIIFVLDAAHAASKRDGRRRAWVLGGVTSGGIAVVLVFYALYARGILPSAFTGQLTLSLILVMGYELSLDVLRAGQLSRSLQQAEDKFRLTVEASPNGIVLTDGQGRIVLVNAETERLFGYSRDEMIGQAVELLVPERFRGAHPGHRADFLAAPSARAMGAGRELFAQRKDRTEFPVEIGLSPITSAGEVFVLTAVVDITARKESEREALQQRMELAHVARVATMGQLASSLAHELNQPLGAILRNAEAAQLLLKNHAPDLEEIRAILADICADDQRAGAVIDHTRSMLKKRDLELSTLAADELVEGVVALIRSDAAGRQVHVQVQLASKLPTLRGDRVQLQQVLLNLIMNGMEAMTDVPAAERRLVVRARRVDGTSMEFEVSDSGPGIPADRLPRVFDPFFTTKRNGLGMGLPISRAIIEAHGGHITAENNPGRGAAFRFTVPVAAEGLQP